MTLEELNGLPAAKAEEELLKCCGSQRWARTVAARRPFKSKDDLQTIAEQEWWKLKYPDWLEAFSHHPRIGERAKAQGFAKQEQAGTSGASDNTLLSLESLNRLYEEKFGFVFLIFATGKTADEMLGSLQRRLQNGRDVELKNAVGEQAKITRLRLEKLLSADPTLRSGDR
jgi:2-oxo-4-hydroxy-4-carboxy-5-ureidoimidazoline decarboxylase